MINKRLYVDYFVRYFCFILLFSPVIAYSDETKEDYIKTCDVVFTARYAQAGKIKRYLVEDIFKGSVDKEIMSYVMDFVSKEEKYNEEFVLFLIRNKPNLSISYCVIKHRKVSIIHGDTSSSMSLEEIQGIIKKQSQESSKE